MLEPTDLEEFLRERLRVTLDQAYEEFLKCLIREDDTGGPIGVLNNQARLPDMFIVHPNIYKELTGREEPHREISACLVSLLLDGLPTREPWLLPSPRGQGGRQETRTMQILRDGVPMQVSYHYEPPPSVEQVAQAVRPYLKAEHR